MKFRLNDGSRLMRLWKNLLGQGAWMSGFAVALALAGCAQVPIADPTPPVVVPSTPTAPPPIAKRPPKIGLALGGGAARGFAPELRRGDIGRQSRRCDLRQRQNRGAIAAGV